MWLYTIPLNNLGTIQAILTKSFSLLFHSWKLSVLCFHFAMEQLSTVLTLAESLFLATTYLWTQAVPYWNCIIILKLYFFPVQNNTNLKSGFLFCSLLFPCQILWCCIIILFMLFVAFRLSSFTLTHMFSWSDYFRDCVSNLFFLKSFLSVPKFHPLYEPLICSSPDTPYFLSQSTFND